MVFDVMAMLVAGLTIAFIAGAEVPPCPPDTVSVNLTTTADIQRLTDAMNCSGEADFNVTWSNSLQLGSRIKVSTRKHVTITGSSNTPTVRAAPHDTNENSSIIGAGDISGIFLVADGSTLTINNMALDGGYSEDGGAVAVLSSSYLNVVDCVFMNNNALNGGAIYANRSEVNIHGSSQFDNNFAADGGAIRVSESAVVIGGNTSFAHNFASSSGGKNSHGTPSCCWWIDAFSGRLMTPTPLRPSVLTK